jgi:hypothetical protein
LQKTLRKQLPRWINTVLKDMTSSPITCQLARLMCSMLVALKAEEAPS